MEEKAEASGPRQKPSSPAMTPASSSIRDEIFSREAPSSSPKASVSAVSIP